MKTKKFDAAKKMPPLRHSIPDQPFDILKSEVVRWLFAQPEVAQYVFDKAKDQIVYDPDSGTWRGRDY